MQNEATIAEEDFMDAMRQAIDIAVAKLRELETQVAETKKIINGMCKLGGQPPMFPDTDEGAGLSLGGFRSDQFYGQPLTKVVRDVLSARKAANLGAASVNQIYDAMTAGGYRFDASSDENAKRALRISLTKNSAVFHKLPNGEYGLREWYPNIKDAKEAKSKPSNNGAEAGADQKPEQAPDDDGFDFAAKEKAASA
jgi:hypothetical protein